MPFHKNIAWSHLPFQLSPHFFAFLKFTLRLSGSVIYTGCVQFLSSHSLLVYFIPDFSPNYSTKTAFIKFTSVKFPVVAQRKRIQLASMRMQVRSLILLSGLRIWCCSELWCRSKTWLGSCISVAVVEASSYSSNLTCILGTSICLGYRPKKQ